MSTVVDLSLLKRKKDRQRQKARDRARARRAKAQDEIVNYKVLAMLDFLPPDQRDNDNRSRCRRCDGMTDSYGCWNANGRSVTWRCQACRAAKR